MIRKGSGSIDAHDFQSSDLLEGGFLSRPTWARETQEYYNNRFVSEISRRSAPIVVAVLRGGILMWAAATRGVTCAATLRAPSLDELESATL
jgi:hypothetical protein